MSDLGGLFVDEFVEITTFGFEGCRRTYRFAGHTHPDRHAMHKYLFEKMGFAALVEARRIYYEIYKRLEGNPANGRGAIHTTSPKSQIPPPLPLWQYLNLRADLERGV